MRETTWGLLHSDDLTPWNVVANHRESVQAWGWRMDAQRSFCTQVAVPGVFLQLCSGCIIVGLCRSACPVDFFDIERILSALARSTMYVQAIWRSKIYKLCILIYIYIYYIHPELRIRNCRFGSGKGVGPL